MPVKVEIIPSRPPQVSVEVCKQGPPGPPGPLNLPDPAELPNGRMIATADGAWVDIPPPSGTGDMQTLVYDPAGRETNVFDIANMSGVIDCGTF